MPAISPPPTRVLLADRRGNGRRALAGLLRSIAGVLLVGEPGDGDELRAALIETRPDVLIVDDRLVGAPAWPGAGTRVIVIGADDDPGFAARAARLGAEAWVAKDRAAEILPQLLAVRVISRQVRAPEPRRDAALGSAR
jgi:DNA-binding NarL/FixJ family response regulator